jgi:hypothetical protein
VPIQLEVKPSAGGVTVITTAPLTADSFLVLKMRLAAVPGAGYVQQLTRYMVAVATATTTEYQPAISPVELAKRIKEALGIDAVFANVAVTRLMRVIGDDEDVPDIVLVAVCYIGEPPLQKRREVIAAAVAMCEESYLATEVAESGSDYFVLRITVGFKAEVLLPDILRTASISAQQTYETQGRRFTDLGEFRRYLRRRGLVN